MIDMRVRDWIAMGVALAAFAALGITTAEGHDRKNSVYNAWMEKQKSRAGYTCCDHEDAYYVADGDWEAGPQGYRVRIKSGWEPVHDGELLDPAGGPNPTGKAIVWYKPLPSGGVYVRCFTPAFES